MPELLIKYKNPKVKEALMDFSKYLDFSIVQPSSKKAAKKIKKTDDNLYLQIEKSLAEVKKIKAKSLKGITIKEMLNKK